MLVLSDEEKRSNMSKCFKQLDTLDMLIAFQIPMGKSGGREFQCGKRCSGQGGKRVLFVKLPLAFCHVGF